MFLSKYPELAGLINKEGNNCTHIAASKGSVEVMKALIKSDPTMAFAKNKVKCANKIIFNNVTQVKK